MNEIATPPLPVTEELPVRVVAPADRLLAAFPLASVYISLCAVYIVEAWKRVTPWLFTDELEMTQLSRSIAATGRAARRGAAHSPDSIYTYLMAPIWLIHDVSTAYSYVKYFDVLVMTSVIFPTYFLARLVVGRRAALFAAAGAGAIPSVAYSSYIVEEILAYPYAALCFFLIVKALVVRRHGWTAAAVLATLFAPAVRGELVMLPVALVLVLVFVAGSSDRARSRRRSWSLGDWIGALTLAFGVIFLVSGIASHHVWEWQVVTRAYKHRMIVEGNWAAGSLAIGTGMIPLVAGLASLVRAPGEKPDRSLRMFRCAALGGLIAFGLYTTIKAAYLSTVFATRVEERNLIYIAPLLFVGTAVVLERRRVNLPALVAAAAYVAYLAGYAVYHAVGSPYEMGVRLYSDALGFALAQQANLHFYWTPSTVRVVLVLALACGLAALLAPRFLPGRARLAGAISAALAVAIVAWNLTGEIAAAAGTNEYANGQVPSVGQPFSWVDDVTGGRPTLYLGQGVSDQTPEWLLEFWNRSITGVSSLDGTIKGPGPAGGPNITANGTLYWSATPADLGRQYDYAVEDFPCVDFAGTSVADHAYRTGDTVKSWRLIQLTHPNRLLAECTGISPDGWTGPGESSYVRFGGGRGGWLRVVVSRRDWGGPTPPSPYHVLIGPLQINANQEPQLIHVTAEKDGIIASTKTQVVWLRAPEARFTARVVVDSKFVPCQVEPQQSSDCRVLGAEVSYRFFARRP